MNTDKYYSVILCVSDRGHFHIIKELSYKHSHPEWFGVRLSTTVVMATRGPDQAGFWLAVMGKTEGVFCFAKQVQFQLQLRCAGRPGF